MKKGIFIVSVIALVIIVGGALGYGIYKNIDHTVPYDYELENYIKVGDYKELPYYKETAEVSDEDVDTEIKSRLEKAAKSEQVKEGTVTEGDSVNIAYVGKIDGEEFEGGKSDSYDLEIGSGTFIDGFESGLTGHSIGETVVLNLRFPEDYHNADVAGKPVEFTVTINYKTVKETPELDEGFVKDNTKTGSKTVDAYKKEVKEELLKKKQDSIDNAMKDELWSYISDNSEVTKYPEKELGDALVQAEKKTEQYKAQASSYGYSWAEYLAATGMNEESFAQRQKESAQKQVKDSMMMYYIARKEGIKFTNREYKKRIAEILDMNGISEEDFKTKYSMTPREYADQNGWREGFYLEKVLDRIESFGKEVTKDEYEKIKAERDTAAEGASASSDNTASDASAQSDTSATD